MKITVELDVFSGRPNPTWTMTPDESKKLMTLLDSLPEVKEKEDDDGLGYHGLTLTIDPENSSPYHVHVFNSIISIESGTKKYFQDFHGLEKWLLGQASGKGYSNIVDSLLP